MSEQTDVSLEAALRRLLAEIALGNYRDSLGHVLTNNTAYLEALAVLELMDVFDLERGRPGGC